jgi:hypothetical protein
LDSPANKEDQDQALFNPGIIAYKYTYFFLILFVIGTECEGQQSEQYPLLTTADPQAPHFLPKRLCVVIMKTENFEARSTNPIIRQSKRTKEKRRASPTRLSKSTALCKMRREN